MSPSNLEILPSASRKEVNSIAERTKWKRGDPDEHIKLTFADMYGFVRCLTLQSIEY